MDSSSLTSTINNWIQDSALLRITVLQGRGNSAVYHGRIVNYLSDTESILLYNDDTKQVENISLSHVDDILQAGCSFPKGFIS